MTDLNVNSGAQFASLNLPAPLLTALTNMGYLTMTPIQAEAIPAAITGRDILGSAQTGTGKTAAFLIPIVTALLADETATALIMLPTRELASQVTGVVRKLCNEKLSLRTAMLIGGEPIFNQLKELKARPRIIVGTPGRIKDHLDRKSLSLRNTKFLVLDETDRMLDMGFGIQIEGIVSAIPAKPQTLMFSATLPKNIVRLADNYLENPVVISVDPVNLAGDQIKQEVIHTTGGNKYSQLLVELGTRTGSIIIFVKTKSSAERISDMLNRDNHQAVAMHGDLGQSKRTRVISAFRSKKHRIMVATDVAARGLDIKDVELVINMEVI